MCSGRILTFAKHVGSHAVGRTLGDLDAGGRFQRLHECWRCNRVVRINELRGFFLHRPSAGPFSLFTGLPRALHVIKDGLGYVPFIRRPSLYARTRAWQPVAPFTPSTMIAPLQRMSLPWPPDTLLSRRHRLPCARKTRSTFTFKARESRNFSPTSMVLPAIEAGVAGVSTAPPNVAICLDIRAVCGACLCKLSLCSRGCCCSVCAGLRAAAVEYYGWSPLHTSTAAALLWCRIILL